MIIVKEPNKRRKAELAVENCAPRRFRCKRCECEFIASGSEYMTIGRTPYEWKEIVKTRCPSCEYSVETAEFEHVTAKDLMEIWEEEQQ